MRAALVFLIAGTVVIGLVYTIWERDRRREERTAAARAQVDYREVLAKAGAGEEMAKEQKEAGLREELILKEKAVIAAKLQMPPPTEMVIDSKKRYGAILHTSEGDVAILLHTSMVPKTVNNFIYLAKKNFYDNTVFHRVIKDFMIQGGDPINNGTGGPGYRFSDEKFKGKYIRGAVAMANAGPNTNGSQFFIMQSERPLVPNYVIFGQVVQGMEVVDSIASAPVKSEGEGSSPVVPAEIKSIEIVDA